MKTALWFPLAREYSMNIISLTSVFRWEQVFPNYYGRPQYRHNLKVFKVYYLKNNMKKLTKKEAEDEIKEFFQDIKNKKTGEVKKIKRLAMKHNIKLKDKRKKFCKKCYSIKLKVKKVKNKVKTIECENCGSVFRWKLR